jgi:hypothetical protein
MYEKITYPKLKEKTKHIEKYLETKIDNFDSWPRPDREDYWPTRWIMEYYQELKHEYYIRRKRAKKNNLKGGIKNG